VTEEKSVYICVKGVLWTYYNSFNLLQVYFRCKYYYCCLYGEGYSRSA